MSLLISLSIIFLAFYSIEYQQKLGISDFFNKPVSKKFIFNKFYGYDILFFILIILLTVIQIRYRLAFVTNESFDILDILNISFVVLGLYGVYISFLQFIVSFSGDKTDKFYGKSKSIVIIEQNSYIQITRRITFSILLCILILFPLCIYIIARIFPNNIHLIQSSFPLLISLWQSSIIVLSIIFILLIIKNIDIPIKSLLIDEDSLQNETFRDLVLYSIENEFTDYFIDTCDNNLLSSNQKILNIERKLITLLEPISDIEKSKLLIKLLYSNKLFAFIKQPLCLEIHTKINTNKYRWDELVNMDEYILLEFLKNEYILINKLYGHSIDSALLEEYCLTYIDLLSKKNIKEIYNDEILVDLQNKLTLNDKSKIISLVLYILVKNIKSQQINNFKTNYFNYILEILYIFTKDSDITLMDIIKNNDYDIMEFNEFIILNNLEINNINPRNFNLYNSDILYDLYKYFTINYFNHLTRLIRRFSQDETKLNIDNKYFLLSNYEFSPRWNEKLDNKLIYRYLYSECTLIICYIKNCYLSNKHFDSLMQDLISELVYKIVPNLPDNPMEYTDDFIYHLKEIVKIFEDINTFSQKHDLIYRGIDYELIKNIVLNYNIDESEIHLHKIIINDNLSLTYSEYIFLLCFKIKLGERYDEFYSPTLDHFEIKLEKFSSISEYIDAATNLLQITDNKLTYNIYSIDMAKDEIILDCLNNNVPIDTKYILNSGINLYDNLNTNFANWPIFYCNKLFDINYQILFNDKANMNKLISEIINYINAADSQSLINGTRTSHLNRKSNFLFDINEKNLFKYDFTKYKKVHNLKEYVNMFIYKDEYKKEIYEFLLPHFNEYIKSLG